MFYLQQQAALMAAATAQGTYINPMAALAHVSAGQLPHGLNGMPNPVVPPTSGMFLLPFDETLMSRMRVKNARPKVP